MKIVGITRIRNEQEIIKDTLDHFSQFCNGGIYVYDDASNDRTVEICKAHPNVKGILEAKFWNPNRFDAEYQTRQAVLQLALRDNPDWIIYFDADERIEIDLSKIDLDSCDAIWMKLFDFYITPEDIDKPYTERKWMGCEYRRIIMMFKNLPGICYHIPDQRIVTLPPNAITIEAGYVRHYGKAVSVKQWEETCEYYMNNFPEPYRTKWANRRGKAVHTDKSDFGLPLIQWKEKEEKGIELNPSIEKNNI